MYTPVPQEDAWDVLSGNVFPEMLIQEMIGYRGDDEEADSGDKKKSHPDPIPRGRTDPTQDQRQKEDCEDSGQNASRR